MDLRDTTNMQVNGSTFHNTKTDYNYLQTELSGIIFGGNYVSGGIIFGGVQSTTRPTAPPPPAASLTESVPGSEFPSPTLTTSVRGTSVRKDRAASPPSTSRPKSSTNARNAKPPTQRPIWSSLEKAVLPWSRQWLRNLREMKVVEPIFPNHEIGNRGDRTGSVGNTFSNSVVPYEIGQHGDDGERPSLSAGIIGLIKYLIMPSVITIADK
ncbi:hypothetical protein BDN72DRAFT_865138 [Pluteus cervinus]|uniref:Uncharacterized protein n=1 Tax=Pluteus cervinus TaxID=181527 RepID=A0ACD3A1D7_9AGAR|nr:hypothetical protein BDN72DRAFT_865138 [Pluteus cervinus]